jgi:hypothetical protein
MKMHGSSTYGGSSNIIHIFYEHYLLGPKFMELEGRRFLKSFQQRGRGSIFQLLIVARVFMELDWFC